MQPLSFGTDDAPLKTAGDYVRAFSAFPPDWPVKVATPANGEVCVEHREINGVPVVGVFGSNGGRFGENPLTEHEYEDQSRRFISMRQTGYAYTSIHGDHRLYRKGGMNDTVYGTHFDRRVVERMVTEGLLKDLTVDLERVRSLESRRGY